MKFRLAFIWLLASVVVTAQPEFTLKSGAQLSQSDKFGRSTQALEAFIAANPSRLYDHSEALLLISYNHMQLGDFAGALAANEASLQLKAKLHADDLVNNYVRFGTIHLLRGNHHAALSYLLKAKDYPIEALQLYAIIDGHLAAAYQGLSQFERAEMYYRQSIETLLIEYPNDHPEVVNSFYRLGGLYLAWEKPEEARRYFQLGLDRLTSSSEEASLQTLLHNGLGETFSDAPQQAETYYREALNIAVGSFGAYHRETALASIFLAESLYRQKRRDEAKEVIQLAIKSLAPEQPKISWDQIPDTAKLIIDRALLAKALGLKARWLVDAALPLEQKLSLALANSEIAGKLLGVALDERIDRAERLDLIPIARSALEAGIEAGVGLWEDRKDPNALRRAFQLVEVIKLLEFRVYTAQVLPLSGIFVERARELQRRLQLAEMEFRQRPLDLTVSRKLYQLREDYRELKEQWYSTDPFTYRQRFGYFPTAVSALQSQLPPKTEMLSYFVGEKAIYLFGLGKESLQAHVIRQAGWKDAGKVTAELTQSVQQFQQAINEKNAADFVKSGAIIYQQLLAPAASWLKSDNSLIILPDGPLKDLPFEALLTKTYKKKRIQFHKLPYLVDDFSVEYRQMASAWDQDTPAPLPDYELLYLSPLTDQEDLVRVWPNQRLLFDAQIHSSSLISDGRQFHLLPQGMEVVDQLKALFAQSRKEGHFESGEAATEGLFKRGLGKAHYLHLASYAFVGGASPEEAGLILANATANSDSPEEGLLLASELLPARASATELVSIDFTELHAEGLSREAGMLPLHGRLLLSGVSNVVYTTQKNGSPLFFPSFYEYLLQDYPVSTALQSVKKSMIKKKETAAPHLWSGYRLLGR